METSQVDTGFRHQGSQPGDEIQGLEDDVRGDMPKTLTKLAGQAFAVRCLEPVTEFAIRRQ